MGKLLRRDFFVSATEKKPHHNWNEGESLCKNTGVLHILLLQNVIFQITKWCEDWNLEKNINAWINEIWKTQGDTQAGGPGTVRPSGAPQYHTSPTFRFVGFVLLSFNFLCSVLHIIVCPLVLFGLSALWLPVGVVVAVIVW